MSKQTTQYSQVPNLARQTVNFVKSVARHVIAGGRINQSPTNLIDDEAEIGNDTTIWHWSHICRGAIVGDNCTIGQGVYIGPHVQIGNGVKIQNNCFIPEGVSLADNVFLGPGCIFTNDKYPPSKGKHWLNTCVHANVVIGAGCVILPGIIIHQHAFIGAGSVVTKNVDANATGFGNPFRIRGKVSPQP